MKRLSMLVLVGMVLALSAGMVSAQDDGTSIVTPDISEAPDMPMMAEGDYSYGSVVAVDSASNRITISEYNYENDSESNVTYSVDINTKYENAGSLNEIQAGDDVDIDYTVGGDNVRTATAISVYR